VGLTRDVRLWAAIKKHQRRIERASEYIEDFREYMDECEAADADLMRDTRVIMGEDAGGEYRCPLCGEAL
jgi:hypothetical protein